MGKYRNPLHSKDTHPLGVIFSGSCPLWLFMMTQVQVSSSVPGKGYLRSPKFTKSFFAYNFWLRRDTDMRLGSLCLPHQGASNYMQYYLYWPSWVITWSWPEVKFCSWPCVVMLYIFRRALTRETRWCIYQLPKIIISKVIFEKKNIFEKYHHFYVDDIIFGKFDLWWALVTSIFTWEKYDQYSLERNLDKPSNAFLRFLYDVWEPS